MAIFVAQRMIYGTKIGAAIGWRTLFYNFAMRFAHSKRVKGEGGRVKGEGNDCVRM